MKQKFLPEISPRRKGCNIDNPTKQVREMTGFLGSISKDSYEPTYYIITRKKVGQNFFWTRRRLPLITFWKISIKSRKFWAWSRKKNMKRTLFSSRSFYPEIFSGQIECFFGNPANEKFFKRLIYGKLTKNLWKQDWLKRKVFIRKSSWQVE